MARYEHQRPRTVNPVLAIQGITKFARSIPSVPADVLRELERADDVLRGTSAAGAKVRLQSRAAAFGEAEARVRSALEKMEACTRLATDVMENKDTLAMSAWLRSMVARTMSGNTVPRAVVDKPELDRLCSLLTVLISKWPRGERWYTKADRASAALVRVASTEDAPGLLNERCVPFLGSCTSAVFDGGAMCALLGASLGSGAARDDMTTKKRKRWGNNDVSGSSSGETDQTSTRNCATPPPPPPSLGVATASSPPTIYGGDSSEKEMDGRPFSRVRSGPDTEPPPPPPVLLDALNISSTTSTTTRDTETEDAETDAALASVRSELEAANAVIMAGDANRASRVYRSAIARLELVRCSTSERQRRRYGRKVLDHLRRASTRARAAAHVIENATVEHVDPCAWGDQPLDDWREVRDSDVLHRAGVLIAKKDDAEAPLLDLFTDDDEDEDMESTPYGTATRPHASITLASSHQSDDWCVHCLETKVPSASETVRQRRSRLFIDKPLETRSLSVPEALEQVYELGDTLGKGSYGVVRIATRRMDGAKFACKTILLDAKLSDAALDRLHSEIAAMRKLDHPNICRLHDVFYAKRAAHLVMDLCTGGELWQYVLRQGRARSDHHSSAGLDEAAAARFARQMLSAVRYMHEAGVCHRDLKPQNWLFATSERDSPLKLIDFGLARHFCERPVPVVSDATGVSIKVRRHRGDDISTDTESVESFGSDLSTAATGVQRPCASCCTTTLAGVGGLFENGKREVVFGRPDAPDSQRRASFDENAVLPMATKEPIEHLPSEDDHSDESDELRAMPALEDVGALHPVIAAQRLFGAGYAGSAFTAVSLSAACPETQRPFSVGGADPQQLPQYWIPAEEEPAWTASAAAAIANWPEIGVFAAAAAAAAPASAAPEPARNDEWENFLALRREAVRAAAERARRSKRGYLSDRVGSFYFVAPEVLRGSHDARCDLWSLGVIVYMLLSGAPPFGGRTDKEILARVSKAKLAFPDKLFCDTTAQARLFVARLLDRDVDRRMTASRALHEEWITTHATPPYDRESRSARIARSARQFAQLDGLSKLAVVVVAARLPHNEIGDVAADFAAFDQDGDGRLSLSEFFAALGGRVSGDKCASSELGVDVEEAAALFDALDVKGDGRAISYREFVAANLCGRLRVTEHRLRDAFEAIDIEATGYLTPRAVRNFVGVDRCVGVDDHDASAILEHHIAESADKAGLDFPRFSRLFFAQYPHLDLDGDLVIPDCAATQRMSSSSSL